MSVPFDVRYQIRGGRKSTSSCSVSTALAYITGTMPAAPPTCPCSDGARQFRSNGYTIYLVGDDPTPFLRDAYHTFLSVPWGASLGLIAAAFLAINLVFAVDLLRDRRRRGHRPARSSTRCRSASRRMATIGYGVMNPRSGAANAVMIVESIVGHHRHRARDRPRVREVLAGDARA